MSTPMEFDLPYNLLTSWTCPWLILFLLIKKLLPLWFVGRLQLLRSSRWYCDRGVCVWPCVRRKLGFVGSWCNGAVWSCFLLLLFFLLSIRGLLFTVSSTQKRGFISWCTFSTFLFSKRITFVSFSSFLLWCTQGVLKACAKNSLRELEYNHH